MKVEPLLNDEFIGEPPAKRALGYIQSKKEQGHPVAGIYCGYAPVELIQAMGMVPAVLCAFSNATIKSAEEVLPANLCPLIKSSFGFVITDNCPFFDISDTVIAETTCDGKKKMFELISDRKPMHVMDLPQVPDAQEAVPEWAGMIRKLQSFLEDSVGKKAADDKIEEAIIDMNKKSKQMRKIFEFAALNPPVISWSELYGITFLTMVTTGADIEERLNDIISKLDKRVTDGYSYGEKDAPRVMVTGCPVGGDALKIFKIIEEAGGVVVVQDSCTGMKPFMFSADEGTDDPVSAISEKYLKIPCSCMTPNNRRLEEIDKMIAEFKPDAVIDFVLHACHSYNIESHKVGEHVKNRGIQFMKIVSDYSDSDNEQIKTRVEALFESL